MSQGLGSWPLGGKCGGLTPVSLAHSTSISPSLHARRASWRQENLSSPDICVVWSEEEGKRERRRNTGGEEKVGEIRGKEERDPSEGKAH